MKKWKCTVCGYIHTGDEPPESCPVCGAGADLFEEVIQEADPAKEEQIKEPLAATEKEEEIVTESPKGSLDLIIGFVLKHHIHPISVHTPNGVLPLAVILYLLAWIFDYELFAKAGFINLVFVVLAFPVVVSTGIMEWKNKYNSALTTIFKLNIFTASLTVISCVITMIWYLLDSNVLETDRAWAFILINLISLASAGVAGFIGGKFVFKD